MAEPLTLYKLMIMYMLKKVNFALSNTQISDFFLSREYTDYFTLQVAFSELLETSLIQKETIRNTSRYEMTQEGEEALSYFSYRISDEIKQDIDNFIKENNFKLRTENSVIANYYRSPSSGEYEVKCTVMEGKDILIELKLNAASQEIAERMCDMWSSKSRDIYEYVVNKLL